MELEPPIAFERERAAHLRTAALLGRAREALVRVSGMDGVGPGAQGTIATALHATDPNRTP